MTERPGVGFRSDRSRRAFPLKSGNLAQLRQLGPTIAAVGVLDPCGWLLGGCGLDRAQRGAHAGVSASEQRIAWKVPIQRAAAGQALSGKKLEAHRVLKG